MSKPTVGGHSSRCRIVIDTCADLSPEIAATLDGYPGLSLYLGWRGIHRRYLVVHYAA